MSADRYPDYIASIVLLVLLLGGTDGLKERGKGELRAYAGSSQKYCNNLIIFRSLLHCKEINVVLDTHSAEF